MLHVSVIGHLLATSLTHQQIVLHGSCIAYDSNGIASIKAHMDTKHTECMFAATGLCAVATTSHTAI